MVWFWVAAVWLVLALAVSLALVRGVRLADRRAARTIGQTPPVDDDPVVDEDPPSPARLPLHRSAHLLRTVTPRVAERSRPRSRRH
jgi:hypothetical protein